MPESQPTPDLIPALIPYTLSIEDPDSPDAVALLEALSDTLNAITGASGRASFQAEDVRVGRGCFVVARLPDGTPVGCGALRPLDGDIAEVKRMYAQPGTVQLGRQILAFLEAQAKGFGYTAIWLETRLINTRAVQFYERQGYRRIPNYGRYVGRSEAVCFAKELGSA